jgi:hypothetical protein
MAAMHVLPLELGGKFAQDLEKALIGPPVKGHQLGDFLQGHGSSSLT